MSVRIGVERVFDGYNIKRGGGMSSAGRCFSGSAAFLPFFAQSNLKNRPDTAILLFSNGFYFFINDNETGSDYGEL
jgi:hypothetical protein